jgi:ornithine carbamoyltransferase
MKSAMTPQNDILPSRPMLQDIVKRAKSIDSSGFSAVRESLQKVGVIGRIFHGESPLERQVTAITATRLGHNLIDVGWNDASTMSMDSMLDSVRMSSLAVDLLLTAFSSGDTFGEGRILTNQFAGASHVPLVSLHDDVYAWQDALTTLLGLEGRLGSVSGKQVVVTWGFGKSFVNPAPAHSLLVAALAFGANVRLVTPPEFSFLNRVRRVAQDTSMCSNVLFDEVHEFEGSFRDADVVFALNWLRLDDFNHPERNQDHAMKYRDWFIDEGVIPKECVFSSVPPVESGLLVSRGVLESDRSITSLWLKHRVTTLAATIAHMFASSSHSMI